LTVALEENPNLKQSLIELRANDLDALKRLDDLTNQKIFGVGAKKDPKDPEDPAKKFKCVETR